MSKQHILDEIKRTAIANGGVPLGRSRFYENTGIKESDWIGKYWIKWNDALTEAGFAPNSMQASYSEEYLLECYARLILDLGHIPTNAEVRFKSNSDADFPSHNTFSKFGRKTKLLARVLEYSHCHAGFEMVGELCQSLGVTLSDSSAALPDSSQPIIEKPKTGFVYLLRHGSRNEYKIGKTYNPLRREGEIRIQLPEKLSPVHYIETDDPSGIEQYWHNRYSSKRKEGEWFNLSSQDVAAFKRWRKIY